MDEKIISVAAECKSFTGYNAYAGNTADNAGKSIL